VSLTKPEAVQKACPSSTAASCVDNDASAKGDAGRDASSDPRPDLRSGDEPAAVKPDAGPDVSPRPDVADDPGNQAPDGPGAEVTAPPEDVAPDNAAPAAEPVAEPSGGPEPRPEPGPEPGPEPAPEPAPEPPLDGGSDSTLDASTAACANAKPVTLDSSKGQSPSAFNTTGPYCFVTCDDLPYWGCSSFSDTTDPTDKANRTLKVNGTPTKCGGTLPAKKAGGYYYFELGPGGNTWDSIWWSGPTATSCPTGGFSP
jgi:hypothetical protein